MTERITRITAILTRLQSKQVVKAEELAKRFEVSIRTIYRDLKCLQEAGIPLGAEAGTGYYLAEGFRLPPVMFTEEEAHALVTAGKIAERYGDRSLTLNFDSALARIKAVLRSSQKENADLLSNRIAPSANRDAAYRSLYLSEIQQAIVNSRVVEIKYHSLSRDEITNREIEPLALYFTAENWILVAWCRLRKDEREFRIDRIQHLRVTGHVFSRGPFDFTRYFEKAIEKNQSSS